MAIKTVYSIERISSSVYEPSYITSDADVAGTNDGLFATAAVLDGVVWMRSTSIDGTASTSAGGFSGTDPTIAATTERGHFAFAMVNGSGVVSLGYGAQTLTSSEIGMVGNLGRGTNPDIAARLYSNVAVAYEVSYVGGDSDIYLSIRSNDDSLTEITKFAVDGSAAVDRNASVAVLNDGKIVVAWDRTYAVGSHIWYAIYDRNGNVVSAPQEYDGYGDVNRAPSVAALANGGFSISYEDNESGKTQIASFVQSPDGRFRAYAPATTSGDVGEVSVAGIGDLFGMVYTQNVRDGSTIRDQDLYFTLTDPVTGRALTDRVVIDNSVAVTHNASISAIPGSTSGDRGEFVITYDQDNEDGEGLHVHQVTARVVETITGDAASNRIEGRTGGRMVVDAGSGNDRITDSMGNDSLFGGVGNDTMVDRYGNDTFDGGAGIDTVDMSASISATTYVDLRKTTAQETGLGRDLFIGIENLIGSATTDDTFYGNDLDNLLDGGGQGFMSADKLSGGKGNDTYVIGSQADTVIEGDNAGVDVVYCDNSYSLTKNVEKLVLTSYAGSANGTGNSLANTITGNAYDNVLDGKAGADTLIGGAGNDTYVVDDLKDVVTEAGGGIDLVMSSHSFTLAGKALENLTLTGTGSTHGDGNSYANVIVGNSAANQINGGLGADTLAGGAGHDYFLFNTALGPTNVDTITDFSVADDTIRLAKTVFVGLTTGTLSSAAFHIGTAAADSSDRIIYDSGTGKLLFDDDGTGAHAAKQFAVIAAGLALTNADFQVV